MAEQLSGLAGKIRSADHSEQFDLAGYDEGRVSELMASAFGGQPLHAPQEMVRFTFLVGGGKLVRARYPDDLPKWVCAALRAIGFSEDRSAAETFDSQGTFKQQHDTGQNLKYVIVYPRVACSAAPTGGESADAGTPAAKTPQSIMCSADLDTFKKRVASKTSSWRQCRRLLKVLQDHAETMKSIEEKLCSGAALSPAEQAKYDSNSGADEEKIVWLQGEIKRYMDEGQLTSSEKAEAVSLLDGNLATLDEKLAEARAEGKAKKVEKMEEMRKEGMAKKAALEKVPPIQLRLKHGDEVQALHLKLLPLVELEGKGRSCSLTMDDLKKLSVKPDLEEEIAELEAASRGWFEADEDFQARCEFEKRAAAAKHAKKGTGKVSGAKPGATGGWATAGSGAGKKAGTGSNAAKKAGPTGFAALALLDD